MKYTIFYFKFVNNLHITFGCHNMIMHEYIVVMVICYCVELYLHYTSTYNTACTCYMYIYSGSLDFI